MPSLTTFSGYSALILAEVAADPVIERLDPPRRAAVVMALLGIVLSGLLLVTIILLGGHWVRRMARHKPANSRIASVGKFNGAVRTGTRLDVGGAESSETMIGYTSDTEADQ